ARLLDHIKDPRVRAVAHPGLVVRRITPDVIRDVLAGPCGIAPMTQLDAAEVFDALRREATLCEPSPDGDGALVHRADVRALMLPGIQRDAPATTRHIHEAAVAYYAAEAYLAALPASDHVARREELYHRLMLGQGSADLDRRWDPRAGQELAVAVDELPLRS